VVAVSGTAFTTSHTTALSRITTKVVLLYDGDEAGGNAAIRAGWVLLKAGLEPSIVRPPEGQDPDDWVGDAGKESVISAIELPQRYIDFHVEFNRGSELQGADRQQYIIALVREIKGIENGIIRNDMVRLISEKLMVDEQDLIRTMKTQRVNPVYNADPEYPQSPEDLFSSQVDKAQIELLQLLVQDNDSVRQYVMEHISLELFKAPLLKRLAGYLLDENLAVESSAIIEYFQDKHERDSVAKILFAENQNISPEEIVSDCLKILKSEPLKEKIQSLRIQIREKELKGEDSMEELNAITRLREALNDI
jgi:DNA primase